MLDEWFMSAFCNFRIDKVLSPTSGRPKKDSRIPISIIEALNRLTCVIDNYQILPTVQRLFRNLRHLHRRYASTMTSQMLFDHPHNEHTIDQDAPA